MSDVSTRVSFIIYIKYLDNSTMCILLYNLFIFKKAKLHVTTLWVAGTNKRKERLEYFKKIAISKRVNIPYNLFHVVRHLHLGLLIKMVSLTIRLK